MLQCIHVYYNASCHMMSGTTNVSSDCPLSRPLSVVLIINAIVVIVVVVVKIIATCNVIETARQALGFLCHVSRRSTTENLSNNLCLQGLWCDGFVDKGGEFLEHGSNVLLSGTETRSDVDDE